MAKNRLSSCEEFPSKFHLFWQSFMRTIVASELRNRWNEATLDLSNQTDVQNDVRNHSVIKPPNHWSAFIRECYYWSRNRRSASAVATCATCIALLNCIIRQMKCLIEIHSPIGQFDDFETVNRVEVREAGYFWHDKYLQSIECAPNHQSRFLKYE